MRRVHRGFKNFPWKSIIIGIIIFITITTLLKDYRKDDEVVPGQPITFTIQGYDKEITVPGFSDKYYVEVNSNVPFFTADDMTTTSYEQYAELDSLGRCGQAIANIGQDIMPTDDRGDINSVTPTGWEQTKYDHISGKYLYNRCHIIGYQLAGENANKLNLITGTRAFNVDAMLLFENMIDDYVDETDNHVLLRATPIFIGNNLVASGLLMEAKSVEDDGEGVLFNSFCYNNQIGVEIDYKTGKSKLASESKTESTDQTTTGTTASLTNNIADTKSLINNNSLKTNNYSTTYNQTNSCDEFWIANYTMNTYSYQTLTNTKQNELIF